MKIDTAIRKLHKEYNKAKSLKWIHNPLAFALYRVWKIADAEQTNKEGGSKE